MPAIKWRHNRERLALPIAIMPGFHSENPNESIRIDGILDTGATGTGIRCDIARSLRLRRKGTRRVLTANGEMIAAEYVIRMGFICGDLVDASFDADRQQPFMLDYELVGFELGPLFPHPVLVGMDVIGTADLGLSRNGMARLVIG